MSTVINATNIFSGDICARCGAHMQATHHRLCQERDGTPTALSDREVRKRLGLTPLDATTGEVK
jgi:ribosomal protein L40E